MKTKYIDADNLIVGRMATVAAKAAMAGENVVIVNCEKAIVTGKKEVVLAKSKHARERGHPYHGPFAPRMPDRMVKRTIRGMLPYKKDKGRIALSKVRCYVGVPEKFAKETFETVTSASMEKLKTHNFMKLLDISRELGAKI